jgi:hypothetical protein
MSVRNGMLLLLGLSTLLFLGACGNGGITHAVPPPSGGFSKSNLNGTYVFSVSGIDFVGAPFAMVGTFTANGGGGITGGTFDINDQNTAAFPSPIADAAISGSSTYTLGVDGRGQANLITTTPFGTITLDFVLSTSSHGLVTEYDNNATGSGTLDVQTAGITPTGTYAFSFSGIPFSSSTPYATAGNFTLTGTSAAGLEDFNEGGLNVLTQQTLTGNVAVSSPPTTSLTFPSVATLAFDVFPIDAGQLKFIEMDQFATLSGDAFSQTSATVPTGTLAFTMEGATAVTNPFAAGGFMVTDGANITNASTEDYNDDGNVSPTPSGNFTGTYAPSGSGRNQISFPSGSGFVGGTLYAAYPSTGGLLLLEIDNVGVMSGVASVQSPGGAFSADGYALNLQGNNVSAVAGAEVDDIAEFVANTTGTTITGLLDENTDSNGIVASSAPFSSGVYTPPDANGRGSISTNVGTSSSNTTLNGGFFLNFYSVDGTMFPFIETDSGQVAAGVFVLQNASAAAAAASAHSHVFVVHPLAQAHTARTNKTAN